MTTRSTYPKCATCQHYRIKRGGYPVCGRLPSEHINTSPNFGCILHSSLDSAQPEGAFTPVTCSVPDSEWARVNVAANNPTTLGDVWAGETRGAAGLYAHGFTPDWAAVAQEASAPRSLPSSTPVEILVGSKWLGGGKMVCVEHFAQGHVTYRGVVMGDRLMQCERYFRECHRWFSNPASPPVEFEHPEAIPEAGSAEAVARRLHREGLAESPSVEFEPQKQPSHVAAQGEQNGTRIEHVNPEPETLSDRNHGRHGDGALSAGVPNRGTGEEPEEVSRASAGHHEAARGVDVGQRGEPQQRVAPLSQPAAPGGEPYLPAVGERTLNGFHRVNFERQHEAFAPPHSLMALVVCVQEEVGELAASVLGYTGEKKRKAHLKRDDVLDAVADAMTYLSLVASNVGCDDLEGLLGSTFNMVSKRAGSKLTTTLGSPVTPDKGRADPTEDCADCVVVDGCAEAHRLRGENAELLEKVRGLELAIGTWERQAALGDSTIADLRSQLTQAQSDLATRTRERDEMARRLLGLIERSLQLPSAPSEAPPVPPQTHPEPRAVKVEPGTTLVVGATYRITATRGRSSAHKAGDVLPVPSPRELGEGAADRPYLSALWTGDAFGEGCWFAGGTRESSGEWGTWVTGLELVSAPPPVEGEGQS